MLNITKYSSQEISGLNRALVLAGSDARGYLRLEYKGSELWITNVLTDSSFAFTEERVGSIFSTSLTVSEYLNDKVYGVYEHFRVMVAIEIPLSEVPLYLNSPSSRVVSILKYRLSINK